MALDQDGRREVLDASQLVFVGGCPRSGTTLLQRMMDSHPLICGGPEFDHVPDIVELRDMLLQSVDRGRISAYLTNDDVDRAVGHFIAVLLSNYAHRKGCVLLSEKTPWNVLVFDKLVDVLPEARFVFCVRDPRAVTSSLLEVGDRSRQKGEVTALAVARNAYTAIQTIKRTNAAGFSAAHRSSRVHVVKYELLVSKPEDVTRALCDFLGVEWSERMVRPSALHHDAHAVTDDVWHYDAMYDSDPEPERADKWRGRLSTADRLLVEAAFDDDQPLRSLGYYFGDDAGTPAERKLARLRLSMRDFVSTKATAMLERGTKARGVRNMIAFARAQSR